MTKPWLLEHVNSRWSAGLPRPVRWPTHGVQCEGKQIWERPCPTLSLRRGEWTAVHILIVLPELLFCSGLIRFTRWDELWWLWPSASLSQCGQTCVPGLWMGWGLSGMQAWSCAEPHSNLCWQFWHQDPEKWQEAWEHGDGAKNSWKIPNAEVGECTGPGLLAVVLLACPFLLLPWA